MVFRVENLAVQRILTSPSEGGLAGSRLASNLKLDARPSLVVSRLRAGEMMVELKR